MEFTGEQFIPGASKPRLVDEHTERYKFALAYTKNCQVLDIACGTGSGTKMLSENASQVTGVDLSSEGIEYAKEHYNARIIDYKLASVADELFADNSFDVICSFETIEHLETDTRKKYLDNLRKWLKDDGLLLLSTPNKKITSPFTKKPVNKYHVLEYTENELRVELSPFFEVHRIYGQRIIKKFYTYTLVRRAINLLARLSGKKVNIYFEASPATVLEYNNKKFEPRLFVVLAKKYD